MLPPCLARDILDLAKVHKVVRLKNVTLESCLRAQGQIAAPNAFGALLLQSCPKNPLGIWLGGNDSFCQGPLPLFLASLAQNQWI